MLRQHFDNCNLSPTYDGHKSTKESTKKKISKANSQRVTCPHCNLEGAIRVMRRYHFDKCPEA